MPAGVGQSPSNFSLPVTLTAVNTIDDDKQKLVIGASHYSSHNCYYNALLKYMLHFPDSDTISLRLS